MDSNEKNKDVNISLLIACNVGNIELVKCLLNHEKKNIAINMLLLLY
jgi:ankyrin repeat protein